MAQAQAASHVGCIGPRGGRVDVPGTMAVLPRRMLDDIVCRAAVAPAPACCRRRASRRRWRRAARVVGARLKLGDAAHEMRAPWVVLATGAVPQALIAAGMCERRTPSGIALRGYVRNDAMVGRITALDVVWHRALRPGYGWIFPCRDGVFNIGVGIAAQPQQRCATAGSARRTSTCARCSRPSPRVYAPARELMAGGTLLGELKGAPLRCTLEGARFSRPGLLVTGEAAGSTYSFTGEGIGKALETGIHAAEAVLAAARAGGRRRRGGARRLRGARCVALKPRFELYETRQPRQRPPLARRPLIWRAKKSPRVLARMSGVLNETSNPGNLVSFKGIRRLFMRIGDERATRCASCSA